MGKELGRKILICTGAILGLTFVILAQVLIPFPKELKATVGPIRRNCYSPAWNVIPNEKICGKQVWYHNPTGEWVVAGQTVDFTPMPAPEHK